MKVLIIISSILCIACADSSQKQDVKTKTTSPPLNTLPQNPKYETVYQPMKFNPFQQIFQQPQQVQSPHYLQSLQQRPQYIPIQIIAKPYFVPQGAPQHQAMIIIAQPALVPQSLLYGSQTQQLLNYFHSNPQAKNQFLYGGYQPQAHAQPHVQPQQHVQPTAQTTYMHPVLASPSIGNYILAPAPQYQQYQQYQQIQPQYQYQPVAQPQVQTSPMPAPTTPQPTQLSSINQLAQLAAQQYVTSQMKTAPAIVTGFEHFSPEQQAQIKAQLSSHLGSGYHAVSANNDNQYSSKYVAEQESNEFIPSPQFKPEPATTAASSSIREGLKGRYVTKSKN